MATNNWREILKLTGFIVLLMIVCYTVQAYLPKQLTQELKIDNAVQDVTWWWRWPSGAGS